ncbi:MAG: IS66 family insertion sequence element accessory protein TnpB [Burkholderiales bacterium]|nr:IS66 family insertion sequence element accessory protein TnpB [Burkholderiales bacterium]
MRAGSERLLARVVQVFGSAQAHHGYLFANARATRIKLLVHDGFGVWCIAQAQCGRFVWPQFDGHSTALSDFDKATIRCFGTGTSWQRLEQMRVITRM